MRKILAGIVKFSGSLFLAILLMGFLAVLLGWATFIEMEYGTPVARFLVYRTWEFHLIGGLLGFNILIALLLRIPWKRSHIPFILAHLGIIILLIGCWRTAYQGEEARITLSEGSEKSRAVASSDWLFEVDLKKTGPASDPKSESESGKESEKILIPFSGGPFNWSDYTPDHWKKNVARIKGKEKGLSLHQWGCLQLALRRDHKPLVLYDRDHLKIEVLDYYVCSDFLPVHPLIVQYEKGKEKKKISLPFPEKGEKSEPGTVSWKSIRKTLEEGERIVFQIGSSMEERTAFLQTLPSAETKGPFKAQIVLFHKGSIYRFSPEELRSVSVSKPHPIGKTGYKITGFQLNPTLISEGSDLQGWSLLLEVSDSGNRMEEIVLHSEMAERNRGSEEFGFYGAFWVNPDQSSREPVFGRKWSPNLDKERLEFLQSPDGSLAYRIWNGKNHAESGILDLAPANDPENVFYSNPVKPKRNGSIASFQILQYEPNDEAGVRLQAIPFNKDLANEFYAKVRLRVLLDGSEEIFLLRTIPGDAFPKEQEKMFAHKIRSDQRSGSIRLANKMVDFGFSIRLNRFQATWEPGSSTPSSFSSLVDYLPKKDYAKISPKKDLLIRMNQPGVFYDPMRNQNWRVYQDSWRGPFYPGDPLFDRIVNGSLLNGEKIPRSKISHSVLSLNNDPGRGLKYIGSLLIVMGTALLIYGKRKVKEQTASLAILFCLCALSALFPAISFAQENRGSGAAEKTEFPSVLEKESYDWTSWRLLPVFYDGRIMPLNTYALIRIKEICGSSSPTFELREDLLQKLEGNKPLNLPPLENFLKEKEYNAEEKKKLESWYSETLLSMVEEQKGIARKLRTLFPSGSRKMESYQILYSWIAEPEIWDYIPFIADKSGRVVQLTGGKGKNFLAPSDLDSSKEYAEKTESILQQKGKKYEQRSDLLNEDALYKAVAAAEKSYSLFRAISWSPDKSGSALVRFYMDQILYPDSAISQTKNGISLIQQLDQATAEMEMILASEKERKESSPFSDPKFILCKRTSGTGKESERTGGETHLTLMRQLNLVANIYQDYPVAMNGKLFDRLLSELNDAKILLEKHRNEVYEKRFFSENYRICLLKITSLFNEIVHRTERAALALTENGSYRVQRRSDKQRIREEETAEGKTVPVVSPPVDLAFSAEGSMKVIPVVSANIGSPTEEQDNPWCSIQMILSGPDELYRRFVDPNGGRRYSKESFASDPGKIAEAIRSAAESSRPFRRALLETAVNDDQAVNHVFQKIDYPQEGNMNAEYFYYRLDPFFWMWFFCLLSLIFMAASWILHGWNQFGKKKESHAEVFSFWMGILFLFLSCGITFWGGAIRAWISGWAPVTNMFEIVVLLAFLVSCFSIWFVFHPVFAPPLARAWRIDPILAWNSPDKRIARIMLLPHLLVMMFVIYLTFSLCYREHAFDQGIWTTFVKSLLAQGLLDQIAVLGTIFLVIWFVPRLITALLILFLYSKTILSVEENKESLYQRIGNRRIFPLIGAFTALGIGLLAYYNTTEFNPNIRPLTAVLRSNFWLTIHVFAIIVSYALGTIAWAISMVMLGAYLFGKYEKREKDGKQFYADPALCERLSPILLALIRNAVLFLTVGTILGARWADFSWGRFWSWDPKEVWALVTLLIYLIVLHGRSARYYHRFGLTIGAVLGMFAIIMTGYGLSFVFGGGGRHAYTGGESSKTAILYAALLGNLIWSILASIQYWRIKRKKR
ncbi:MAG: cytochrome c biogenesis protein CcsA [Planctomycetia bacterium]|nr:cytochrome c biogenesis protein CcsA [Planctomycetia bacterium]